MNEADRNALAVVAGSPEEHALAAALLEDRRLRILRLLHAAPAFVANDSVLRTALEGLGHVVSADRLRSDLAWLADTGLLALAVREGLTVSTLRDRGATAALGHASFCGVARPCPIS